MHNTLKLTCSECNNNFYSNLTFHRSDELPDSDIQPNRGFSRIQICLGEGNSKIGNTSWPPLSSFGKSTPPHAAHHIICQWPNDFLVIFILKQIAACTWKYVCVFVFVCLNANVCLCACLCVRACVCLRVRGTQSPNKAGIIGVGHSTLHPHQTPGSPTAKDQTS